jgi:hypothetical protein
MLTWIEADVKSRVMKGDINSLLCLLSLVPVIPCIDGRSEISCKFLKWSPFACFCEKQASFHILNQYLHTSSFRGTRSFAKSSIQQMTLSIQTVFCQDLRLVLSRDL